MVVHTISALEKFVGQKVKDPYDRVVGTLASIYSDVDGTVTAVEIMVNDGVFKTFDSGMLSIKGGEVVLVPEWKYKALKLIEKLERGKKWVKALEDLYAKGEIPKHAYEEFKAKLTRELEKLKAESKEVKEVIRARINELEDQIVKIEKALTALKMSYISGEVSERGYKVAADLLRTSRDKNLEEKGDAKSTLERIQRLEAAEIELAPPAPAKEGAADKQQGAQQQAPAAVGGLLVELVQDAT